MKELEELLEQLELDIEKIEQEIQKKILFKEELKKHFFTQVTLSQGTNNEEIPIFNEN